MVHGWPLINALVGEERLETKEVREHHSRGRHATRHRQLIVLPGRGLLIDTPGMRELQLWDVSDALEETFDDIEALAAACHFTDCRHRGEPLRGPGGLPAPCRPSASSTSRTANEQRSLEARKEDARAIVDETSTTHKALKQLYDRGR